MKRTWLGWLGALVLAAPMTATAQFQWTTNAGVIIITNYTGSGAVSIPATLTGLAVAGIGDYAFYGDNLTSVTISNGISSIGNYAFYGATLTSVSWIRIRLRWPYSTEAWNSLTRATKRARRQPFKVRSTAASLK